MMDNNLSLLVMIIIILILLLILRHDAKKYAITQNVTTLIDDKTGRVYVASHVSDRKYHGAKVLMVLHSLYCRKCKSDNIFVDLSDDASMLIIKCRDCGHTTQIPVKNILKFD
jgi:RNase P subunit RPR2